MANFPVYEPVRVHWEALLGADRLPGNIKA
jgi:hypothetical protein